MPPTVLTFVSWYLPGFKAGGALQSIANLVEHLGNDFNFRIITDDRDMGDSGPYPGIIPGQWQTVGKARVCYLSPAMQRLRPIARLMRETPHDVVYLNSFLHPRFSTLPLLAQRLHLAPRSPTVIAPRGEFSVGALALKAGKKRAFMLASRSLGLHSGLTWQASTEHEAEDIRRAMGGIAKDIRVACDLPRRVVPVMQTAARQPGQALRVVFLSRISPMKNLLFALEVLAQVKVPVAFSIYGPREDAAYWRQCETVIATLPAHVRVEYFGSVEPSRVIPVLSQHDLFFLPTAGENYGHVIAEALMAGLPVLLSDQTPWRGLQAKGIGRDLPLGDMAPFAIYIDHLASASAEEIAQIRHQVALQAAEIGDVSATISANRRLFCGTGVVPDVNSLVQFRSE